MASSLLVSSWKLPQAQRSQLTHRRRPELPCCDDQSICTLASSKPRTFNSCPVFHQLNQSMTIKWIYVLVTPGRLPSKHPGRSRYEPQSLRRAETHLLRLFSSEFTTIHSQHVFLHLSKMFEMSSSFVASQGFECEVSLVYRRCFICI